MKEIKQGLIDVQIRHAWHRVYRMYNQKAMTHGLTISAGFILMNIDKTGTPSTSLGPRMGMEPTSLSRTLKSMEDQGWIRREIASLDKRKVLIFLTNDGLKKRNIVRDFLVDFNEKITKRLTQKELQGFLKTMQAMDEIIDEVVKTD
ncbi:MAG: MarR family winged helix-turn-helix transcriptional regulator [Bacteroidota bacterium]